MVAVSYRSFEAPRFHLRSDWTAGTAALEFRELTSSAMQIARYFTIFLAKKTTLSSLLLPPKRGNGSTASLSLAKLSISTVSRQLSEVRHAPALPVLQLVIIYAGSAARRLCG